MKIQKLNVCDLVEDPKNTRLHGKRNLETVKASILEFDQYAPLVIQQSTMKVLVGNGRLAAVKSLGWTEVDCFVVDVDDTTAKALAIMDNRTADLAEWDEKGLAQWLTQFSESDEIDIELTGFNDDELGDIVDKLEKENAPVIPPEKPIEPRFLEAHNYVLLTFDEDTDWEIAKQAFGLPDMPLLPDGRGSGRATNGSKLLAMLRDNEVEL